jgi:hypothetical protein
MAPVTRSPTRLAATVLALAALAAACGSTPESLPPATTPRTLVPTPMTILLRPGQSGSVSFQVLGPTGMPLPGATIAFAIVDNPDTPGQEAQGAALLTLEATTDAQGVAAAGILTGMPTTFTLRATSADAVAEVTIVVATEERVAEVAVAPFFSNPAGRAATALTTVEIRFYNKLRCADLPLRTPPRTTVPMVTLPPGGVAHYKYVDTTIGHAVVARALLDQQAVVAVGCTDLPGGPTLVASDEVQVAVPLVDVSPDAVGTYKATTEVAITPPLAAAEAIAAVWRDLTDCPLDPAQRWLDCTIDALGPTSDADPLDCVPSPAPGGDGALGDELAGIRGVGLAGPDGKQTACRGSKTIGGAVSADALVQGLFGSPLPLPIVRLEAAADDAAHLFDSLTLSSRLEITAGPTPSAVAVTHTLTGMTFAVPGESADVTLQTLGLPALSGTIGADVLDIAQHGFTVRLGTAGEVAFGKVGLARRGLPPDAPGLVAALAALAHSEDGTLAGCAAMDATLCARTGHAPGCLVVACRSGLEALANNLSRSFEAADGLALDLYLAGHAPLLDTHGNGLADKLGELPATPKDDAPFAGTWTVDLRPRAGRRTIPARWQADRQN